ncbi:AraC-like DNA-binding protein [Caulobacter ginsengisoli]|uniref:AraC-like DNA-binding protein n=1 Tax=Caulobacter ginsengisoli TaxID=400775 RepID=A0ABU0IS08_9CAUL|nr:helix-turn-helix domain-containing protein [Caulobacter ginsengisoli]MDQ0464795.1 AraC-like DNA-binding protein [Caulobacter ginsengisoli]
MAQRYAEFVPRSDLAAHVHRLWLFEGSDSDEDQRIVPDGRPELIVHYGRPYLEAGSDGDFTRQAPVVFAGQLTRPLVLRSDGPAGVIGVRFRPAGALAYLGRPLSDFTDRRVPLDPDLAEGLAGLGEADRLTRIQDHVAARLAGPPDPDIEAIVEALADKRTPPASRDLQRRFARQVGVPPRKLAAILRFRRVFDALSEAASGTWTEAAHAVGYFDHPQLVRDFRRFLGCTPGQFLRQRAGLSASLAPTTSKAVVSIQASRAET